MTVKLFSFQPRFKIQLITYGVFGVKITNFNFLIPFIIMMVKWSLETSVSLTSYWSKKLDMLTLIILLRFLPFVLSFSFSLLNSMDNIWSLTQMTTSLTIVSNFTFISSLSLSLSWLLSNLIQLLSEWVLKTINSMRVEVMNWIQNFDQFYWHDK